MSTSSAAAVQSPSDSLLNTGVRACYDKGLFTDLTLKCGDTQFKVHKIVLYSQSVYFEKMLGGDFKERNMDAIEFEEDSDIFAIMIDYFYSSTLPAIADPVKAVLIYQVADKYDIPQLRQLAASRLKTACSPLDNFQRFVVVLKEINERTAPKDKTLWDIVVPVVKQNMAILLARPDFRATIKGLDTLYFRLLAEMSLSDAPSDHISITPALQGGGFLCSIPWSGGRTLG